MSNETDKEKDNEKKGFFGRFAEKTKPKKNSCCCNYELEEITDDKKENVNENSPEE